MVSSMGPNEWDCSITCFAKLDMWLLVLNVYLCSKVLRTNYRQHLFVTRHTVPLDVENIVNEYR